MLGAVRVEMANQHKYLELLVFLYRHRHLLHSQSLYSCELKMTQRVSGVGREPLRKRGSPRAAKVIM